MKLSILLLSFVAFTTTLSSCFLRQPFIEPTSIYYPILISRTAADNNINLTAAQSVVAAGKFYIYNQYLFLVEKEEGIHIYDNTNIADPENIGFINIMNITDLAISDNSLYANQSTDLVVLDISDISDVKFLSRIKDVASDITPDGLMLEEKYLNDRPKNSIVARWRLIDE